jgi:hypothetical protein
LLASTPHSSARNRIASTQPSSHILAKASACTAHRKHGHRDDTMRHPTRSAHTELSAYAQRWYRGLAAEAIAPPRSWKKRMPSPALGSNPAAPIPQQHTSVDRGLNVTHVLHPNRTQFALRVGSTPISPTSHRTTSNLPATHAHIRGVMSSS